VQLTILKIEGSEGFKSSWEGEDRAEHPVGEEKEEVDLDEKKRNVCQ